MYIAVNLIVIGLALEAASEDKEPILRLLNLQLQRQHCSKQHGAFFKVEENIFGLKTL
jgi:hypothetical protein